MRKNNSADRKVYFVIFTRVASLLFLFLFSAHELSAQILPKEWSKLHYRIIGFSYPLNDVVVKYKIEIAAGNFSNEDSFKKNIIKSVYSKSNKVIAEVPYFGVDYTWQAVYTLKKSVIKKSNLYHFSTLYTPEIDSCNVRLRIIKPAVKYRDNYVFVDGNNALYDMKGNPVWYFPFPGKEEQGNVLARDLKTTPQGTITFLHTQHIFEINYNGDTLWKGPDNGQVSGGDSERYHHEFTRLANGHYMVLGTEHVHWDHPFIPEDSSFSMIEDEKIKYDSNISAKKKTPFGTLIEYDEKGNVVWSWKSSKYFMGSDLLYYRPEGKVKVIDVHENAFYFDEHECAIYISFRNISRVLKISYPEGNVMNTYGEIFRPSVPAIGNGMFCAQHACRKSKEGYLYLYNNNACNDDKSLPTVIMMKESPSGNDSLIKIWEYECSIDGINLNPLTRKAREKRAMMVRKKMNDKSWKATLLHYTSGGNVIELPDRSLFVCMNAQYSKLFIVSHDKKILWSATPEKLNPGNNEWYISSQLYKASIITRKQLERLIWNTAK